MADEQNTEKTKTWGRVFMGDRVAELSDVESQRSRAWTEKDEAEYLAKVRQKAADMAKDILAKAEHEANDIREQAMNDGYAEGIKQAEEELTELRSSMGDTVQAVLGAIEAQSAALTAEWKDDLAGLVRTAIEQCLGIVLAAEKSAVLEGLFNDALQSLEHSRNIVVKCSAEDAPAVEDIISLGKDKYPELAKWKVIADPAITPGGIQVESESSLASNTIEARKAAVMKVLETLSF